MMVDQKLRKLILFIILVSLNLINPMIFLRSYIIEKRDLTHGGGWVPAVSFVDPRNTHATVPRLTEGTKYEFRVFVS